MFVLLRTVEPNGGFLSVKKQKKLLKNNVPISVSTEKGLPFFMLDVFNGKNNPDYPSIAEKCGKYSSRIVAPREIVFPDKSGLKRFVPGASNGIFIFNTALETVKKSGIEPSKISVTVIDRNAVMCEKISLLLPFASPVRVVTSRPERYSSICREVYEEYGASVIVRTAYEPSTKKDVVICCEGVSNASMNDAAVFSFKRGSYGKIRFYGSQIPLTEAHNNIVPKNIRSTDFVAAITELCASTTYKSAVYSDTEIKCDSYCSATPEECLRCYIYGAFKT